MNAGKFTLSYTAASQMAMMDEDEKKLLNDFFASGANLTDPDMKKLSNGAFGSRVGRKLVMWRMNADGKTEVALIGDDSYLERPPVPAHAAE
jgi:hypothetical protein